jgi:hypothetical protein
MYILVNSQPLPIKHIGIYKKLSKTGSSVGFFLLAKNYTGFA